MLPGWQDCRLGYYSSLKSSQDPKYRGTTQLYYCQYYSNRRIFVNILKPAILWRMVITYYGAQFFKIQFGDTVLAINPVSKDSGVKSARFGADIVLVTANDPFFNGVENASFGDKIPYVISGPGEYEIKEIFINGFPSEYKSKKGTKINTIYKLNMEGINICFLGALSSDLGPKVKEEIDGVDILFVPVSGGEFLSPVEASKIATNLEAKIVIPMDYERISKDALKTFLKEWGDEKAVSVDKLTIKKKDLEGKDGEVVVLNNVS